MIMKNNPWSEEIDSGSSTESFDEQIIDKVKSSGLLRKKFSKRLSSESDTNSSGGSYSRSASDAEYSDEDFRDQNLPKSSSNHYPSDPDDNIESSDGEPQLPRKTRPIKNSNDIFKELIKNQLPDVPSEWKLSINDMKRICKYINTSIFDPENCCLWHGYITNINNANKGTYVNFYFRNKKVALHRLLYSNFVSPLNSTEYLKFNCENKGVCCNIYHYAKYKYSKTDGVLRKETKKKEPKKEIIDVKIIGSEDKDGLTVNFD